MNFESITEFIGLLGFIFLLINWLRSDLNKRLDDQSKRFDDLKELFKAELKPIDEKLSNHVTDTHKEIESLNEGQKAILNKLDKMS